MKEVSTQIATSLTADFKENTWTFIMPDDYKVWAGKFAIVDYSVYYKMKEIIYYVRKFEDEELIKMISELKAVEF